MDCNLYVDRYIPTLQSVLLKNEIDSVDHYKKRIMAVELLASLQPLIFFQHEAEHTLSIQNTLYYYASSGSIIWEQIAVSTSSYYSNSDTCCLCTLSVFIIDIAGCLRPREIAGSFLGSYFFARTLRRFIITLFTR